MIKRSDMMFYCDACGRRASREGEWQLKNKSYRANFRCKRQGNRFIGRVQFKLKYDGMVVKNVFFRKGRRNQRKTEKVTELTAQVKRFKSAEGQMLCGERSDIVVSYNCIASFLFYLTIVCASLRKGRKMS